MFVTVNRTESHEADLLEIYSGKEVKSFVLSSKINNYKQRMFEGALTLRPGVGDNNVYVLQEPFKVNANSIDDINIIAVYVSELEGRRIFILEIASDLNTENEYSSDELWEKIKKERT